MMLAFRSRNFQNSKNMNKKTITPFKLKTANIIKPDVMRSASEVSLRLEEAEKELAYHQEWYKKARENYDRDRKFWGQADDGEMRVASDASSESQKEVTILKWVLGHP